MTELFNPFTGETVEVSKAVSPMYGAKNAYADQPTKCVGSLLPTGKHVSHANDLHVTRKGKRTSVGRYGDTKLQRFGKGFLKLGKHGVKNDRDLATRIAAGGHKGKHVRKSFEDLSDLASQPGMINPGVVTSSWSHGTPNQNFAADQGRRGRKIS